jgi:hypothetical protein
MSCIAPLSSVSASVSRLVWWPFRLAAAATTLLLLRLLALALRSRTPTASTPPTDPDDDDDLDAWADAQIRDDCIEITRNYLQHCYDLDPSKYRHR